MTSAAGHRRAVWALALLPVLAAAQSAVLEIRVVEGEGAVQPAGARVRAPWTVLVTDETGRPVAGAAVTFRLPVEGAGGVFSNGLPTEAMRTGPDGRATVREVRWNRSPGPVRIRVVALKDDARAGAVFEQYLVLTGAESSFRSLGVRRRSRWWKAAAVAGGAAAAAVVVGFARAGSPKSVPQAPPVRIGAPVITIGRP